MNLKTTLKTIKLNESTISMFLGAIVIIIVGVLVINYFKFNEKGTTVPAVNTEELEKTKLPTTHTIAEGENLWTISERYYGSGYNWVDIASENNLSDADQIRVGQQIKIPNVATKIADKAQVVDEAKIADKIDEAETVSVEDQVKPTNSVAPTKITTKNTNIIFDSGYTVKKGDSLWKIAEQVYGDGYKWVEIAIENKLSNPDVIHPGNVFILPN